MLNKIKEWGGVVALVAIIALFALGSEPASVSVGGANCNGGNCTDYDAVNVTDGYYVDDSVIITGSGAGFFSGLLTMNGGQLRSYSLSTTTPASMTLAVSDVTGYDTVMVTPSGAASSKALTFFASSSASTWLPTVGDMQETCFANGTSTSAVDITFVAGTGITLQSATSTSGGIGAPTIAPLDIGCFKFVRQSNTDITAAFTTYKDAD